MRMLTMVPHDIIQGEINWEPKDIREAKILIAHLQSTVERKDELFQAVSELEENLRRENNILYQRIGELKGFMKNIGLNVI